MHRFAPPFWAGLLLLISFCATARPNLEFLYINANEGTASGGHVALRFDDEVYHFQHVEPGLLRLFHAAFADFRFQYAARENRTIFVHRLAVSEATYDWLKEAFERRLLIQDSQFQHLKTLESELTLVQQLLQSKMPEHEAGFVATTPVKALGYFVDHQQVAHIPTPSNPSSSIQQLKQQLEQQNGTEFIPRWREKLDQQIQNLSRAELSLRPTLLSEKQLSWYGLYWGQRYQQLLSNQMALQVLEAGTPLLSSQLHTADAEVFELDAAAVEALHVYRQRLMQQLLRLWQSQREDWGQALLIGMARLQAVDHSIQNRRLSVLNRYQLKSQESIAFQSQATEQLLNSAIQKLQQTKVFLDNRIALDEQRYGELESAANAVVVLQQHRQQHTGFSVLRFTTLPVHAADVVLPINPLSVEQLSHYQMQLEQRQQSLLQQMQDLYAYHLLQRNCVTELFRQIELALQKATQNGETAPQVSQRLLGGYVDGQGLQLIPFIAYDAVAEQYRIKASYTINSYRQQHIQNAYHQHAQWQVDLQESNSLTSQIYHAPVNDSAFVFFTQDAIWPRPIQGSLNLLAGAGQSVCGAFSWPWDNGRAIKRGLIGMVVSLPELMFFNIRKGSFPELLPVKSDAVYSAETSVNGD